VPGAKSNDYLTPNYVQSLFKHVKSTEIRRLEVQVIGFHATVRKKELRKLKNL